MSQTTLPQLLMEANGWLTKACRAADLCVEAERAGDKHKARQYVSEWQHAVDMCSQSIEDHWLLVDIEDLTERERALRDAAKTYTAAVTAARNEEAF